jgi:hypothetical protein
VDGAHLAVAVRRNVNYYRAVLSSIVLNNFLNGATPKW